MQIRLIFAFLSLPVLGACGGGGDDVVPTVMFTSFSSVQTGQTVTANGMSQTENVTQNASGVVTAKLVNQPDSNTSSANLTYGTSLPLKLTGLEIRTPQSNVSWRNGMGTQTVSCGTKTCSLTGDGATGVMINALRSLAWNYQTFSYWLHNTGRPANVAGALSVGNPTPVSAMPVAGSAVTYAGVSGGLYVDGSGLLQEHAAVMAAVVDAGAGTIDFSTTGTTIRPWNSTGGFSSPPTPPQLNISGLLNIVAGANRFTGPVTMGPVATPTMRGSVTGVFYGPGAEEIGGTFALTSTSGQIESITGSFGAKH